MKRKYWTADQLILCRSDTGDGGWSLHAPWATDEQIATGEELYLTNGPAERTPDGDWDRPNQADRRAAMNILSMRDKVNDK
jgi:hypothetical protein